MVGYQILNEESRFKFEAAFLFYKIFWTCPPFWWAFPCRSGYRYSHPVKNGSAQTIVYPERSRRALSLTQIQLIIHNFKMTINSFTNWLIVSFFTIQQKNKPIIYFFYQNFKDWAVLFVFLRNLKSKLNPSYGNYSNRKNYTTSFR
ncbi:MAG: hypothetical protein A3F91_14995 [Flavobacteria bacterium RIFCSPLOWO2_12_FULL_35_11]|nr:MAG: hypothetical protein A3F91_14995 [Flavobacteria bacterium RIFCSPLOWO2_12_FULL_35_11]